MSGKSQNTHTHTEWSGHKWRELWLMHKRENKARTTNTFIKQTGLSESCDDWWSTYKHCGHVYNCSNCVAITTYLMLLWTVWFLQRSLGTQQYLKACLKHKKVENYRKDYCFHGVKRSFRTLEHFFTWCYNRMSLLMVTKCGQAIQTLPFNTVYNAFV